MMFRPKPIVWKAYLSYNNCQVPTPFYHLSLAHQLIEHPDLHPAVRSLLQEHPGEFLLGNTAPDVQVISGQARKTTHFFSVPIQKKAQLPWDRLLLEYPSLAHSISQNPDRDAFIAGYLCHLQADWVWVLNVFLPVFGPDQNWETFEKRLLLHNVLRAYLDGDIIAALPGNTISALLYTHSNNWLPFIEDDQLNEWREYLSNQLQPGADVKTVEVFASRQGIHPDEFQKIIHSETRMEVEIFEHYPRQRLEKYRQRVIDQNIELLHNYLCDNPTVGALDQNRSSKHNQYFDRSAL